MPRRRKRLVRGAKWLQMRVKAVVRKAEGMMRQNWYRPGVRQFMSQPWLAAFWPQEEQSPGSGLQFHVLCAWTRIIRLLFGKIFHPAIFVS